MPTSLPKHHRLPYTPGLAIRNEEGITEVTLIMGVKRLNETVTRITVLRDNLEYQTCKLHKYELVRTAH